MQYQSEMPPYCWLNIGTTFVTMSVQLASVNMKSVFLIFYRIVAVLRHDILFVSEISNMTLPTA